MVQKFWWIISFLILVTAVHGHGERRGITQDETRKNPAETNFGTGNKTPLDNQWNNHNTNQEKSSSELTYNRGRDQDKSNQQSSGFYTKEHEEEYSQRPSLQSSQNNQNTDRNQRPNQHTSMSSGHQTNNKETDYITRPHQQFSGTYSNNHETGYNQRPNQHFSSGSSGQHMNNREMEYSQPFPQNNRETEYNQRPNNRDRDRNNPNQQLPSNNRDRDRNNPNQQLPSNNRDRDRNNHNQQSLTISNNQEGEYYQPPSQQSSSNSVQTGTEKNPGGNQYAQRPPTMGSLQPEGSKPLCYGFFGCFSQSEPWISKLRPVPAPLPPDNNSATFYFYSRPNVEQRYLINVYPEFSIGESKFDSKKPTALIIHGFIQDGNELWMEEMKNAYLKHVDANVMIVNWGKGSRMLSYLQAAGNTRLIGSMISYLIKRLMESHGADPTKFHLIGHSLGAQIASYAGKEVPGIGRITALDPAQPGFEGFDKRVRLDKSDAQFVDVIHTNAKPFIPTLGLGMIKPYGHVDFYMNGGFDQPLCIAPPANAINNIKSILDLANLPVNWFSQTFFCDHARAYSYFIEALNNTDCIFWGHKANLKNVAQGVANTLTQGLLAKYVALSTTCTEKDCVPLGFRTEQSSLRGSYVVTTNGQNPYCRSEPGIPSQSGRNRRTLKG